MRFRSAVVCLLLSGLLPLTGCQRVNTSATWQVERGLPRMLLIDAPRSEQKVTATVTASGNPVTACLVLEENGPEAEAALAYMKVPKTALASQEKATDITLNATIPARKGYRLMVAAEKTTEVKVKLTGK